MSLPSPEESIVVIGDPDEGGVVVEGDGPTPGAAVVVTDDDLQPLPGPPGPPGPPWHDEGDWTPGAAYTALSLVHFEGQTYGTPIDLPGMAVFDPGYWRLWASKGDKGEQGEQGIQGPPGGPGAYERTRYDVAMPSAVWTIVHGKGAILPVTVVDSTGRELRLVDVRYPDLDTVEVHFGAATSGYVEI